MLAIIILARIRMHLYWSYSDECHRLSIANVTAVLKLLPKLVLIRSIEIYSKCIDIVKLFYLATTFRDMLFSLSRDTIQVGIKFSFWKPSYVLNTTIYSHQNNQSEEMYKPRLHRNKKKKGVIEIAFYLPLLFSKYRQHLVI